MKRTFLLTCLTLLSGLSFVAAGPSDSETNATALTVTYYYLPG